MVCVTITREPRKIDDAAVTEIRDGFHQAIVTVMKVKEEDVELRVRDVGPFDMNSFWLTIEIDTGPGKDSHRVEGCRDILAALDTEIQSLGLIPHEFRRKGRSNMWLRVYAKGASMPIGCPDDLH